MPDRSSIATSPSGSQSRFEEEAQRRYRYSQNATAEWRKLAKKYYAAHGGDPWPEGAKEKMQAGQRPVVTPNYSLSYINAVLGQDIADRKEARFQGIDGQTRDAFAAEILTSIVRSLYQRCNGHREQTEAQQDQLVTGLGWCQGFLDDRKFPIWPSLTSVDTLQMYWDPDASKSNLGDARFLFHVRDWRLEDAIARWPKKTAELESIAKGAGERSNVTRPGFGSRKAKADGYREGQGRDIDHSLRDQSVTIYDYQFKKLEKVFVYADPATGERHTASKEEFEEARETIFRTPDPETGLPPKEISAAEIYVERVYRAYMASSSDGAMHTLEEPVQLATDMFLYRCATGYRGRDRTGKVQFFGLMHLIYEPQLWLAKAASSMIEHVARAPKGGGGFIKKSLLDDPDGFQSKGAGIGVWTPINEIDGPISEHVFELKANPLNPAYKELYEIFADKVMPQLTTITDFFKGTSETERSNVLVTNLQGQTMMVLNPLVDPMSQLRIENAQLIARLAQLHMAPDDFNRLVGPMEAEGITYRLARDQNTGAVVWEIDQDGRRKQAKIPIPIDPNDPMSPPVTPYDVIADLALFEFDVTTDLGPASTTQKQAIWTNFIQTAAIQKILETRPEVGNRLLPWLVENMPGISADQSKQLAADVREDLHKAEMAGTMEGMFESMQDMAPDALQQLLGFAQQLLQAQVQPAGAGAPVGEQ